MEHIGVVKSVADGVVCVEITSHSACASCNAKGVCGASESAEKIIEVHTAQSAQFAVGEAVVVSADRRMGITAVVLAYVVPVVFLLGALIAASEIGINEGVAALSALFAVIVYYILLWIFRNKINNKIYFTITKQ